MRLRTLVTGRHNVVSEINGPSTGTWTVFEEDLKRFEATRPSDCRGIPGLLTRYSNHGRRGLTDELFHPVDPQGEIWEFVKGRLRVFCFTDDDAMVVLTAVEMKKTQKVDPSFVAAARRARQRFLAAKEDGTIEFVGDLE